MTQNKKRPNLTLVEILTIFIILALIVFATAPSDQECNFPHHEDRIVACSNNLSQLWIMQGLYTTRFGGKKMLMPHQGGSAFWIFLSDPGIGLIEKGYMDIYICQLSDHEAGESLGSGTPCSYRGPRMDVNTLPPDAIVGCDKPGNHGEGEGINVLFKSGEVRFAEPDDPLYQQALEQTCE